MTSLRQFRNATLVFGDFIASALFLRPGLLQRLLLRSPFEFRFPHYVSRNAFHKVRIYAPQMIWGAQSSRYLCHAEDRIWAWGCLEEGAWTTERRFLSISSWKGVLEVRMCFINSFLVTFLLKREISILVSVQMILATWRKILQNFF